MHRQRRTEVLLWCWWWSTMAKVFLQERSMHGRDDPLLTQSRSQSFRHRQRVQNSLPLNTFWIRYYLGNTFVLDMKCDELIGTHKNVCMYSTYVDSDMCETFFYMHKQTKSSRIHNEPVANCFTRNVFDHEMSFWKSWLLFRFISLNIGCFIILSVYAYLHVIGIVFTTLVLCMGHQ